MHEGKHYLIDVLRGRFNYPDLKARAMAHAGVHNPTRILIEDTGVGTALVAELAKTSLSAIGVSPAQGFTGWPAYASL